jgi:hypothetical protein
MEKRRPWQDVYHVDFGGLALHVKFTTDIEGYLVISLKEKWRPAPCRTAFARWDR